MRVTALIGAGVNLDIGGPSTSRLTQVVRSTTQNVFLPAGRRRNIRFIDQVATHLDSYYGAPANFEEIFNCLEYLISYTYAWQATTGQRFSPPLAAFVKAIRRKSFFNEQLLIQSTSDLIESVAEELDAFLQQFQANSASYSWFSSFWRQAVGRCSWDIATLNYDTCVDDCICNFEDGFENTGRGYFRFDPRRIIYTDQSRIMHLHGSILYGYHRESPNLYLLQDRFEDLYKFATSDEARLTWRGRSTYVSQSRERAEIGPIITGLRKTDKLLAFPYSTYYSLLDRLIVDSPRLLIAGYSFSDPHFNNLLLRISRLHGANRRIVILSYFGDPSHWCYDPTVMHWPANHEMYEFIAYAFQNRSPLPRNYTNPLISGDGRAAIYLQGTREALTNHGQNILDFLTS